uniref:Uncharacterized protein n=1 Tax=Rhizophora mucronata TaxID=61149 RepID=A0A2P2IMU1_RHIMU
MNSGVIPNCLDNITTLTWDFGDKEFKSYPWVDADIYVKGIIFLYTTRLLEFVRTIDMSCNNLTGTIPSQMMKLTALRVLNLSHNLLTGQLPATLSNLQNMESLDLSNNKLIGPIPENVTDLLSLEVFNDSFNNLSGPLPGERQITTFIASSYWGNPGLCGQPSEKKCEELRETHQGETNKKPNLHPNMAFISISILVNIFHRLVGIV